MRREAPEPWASAMVASGAVSPSGRPSMTRLAEKAGIAVESVRKLVYGMGTPRPSTVAEVAKALRVDVRLASEWAGQARSVREPFTLPPEADLLNARERRAITELVQAVVQGRKQPHAQNQQEPRQETRSAELGSAGSGTRRSTPMNDQADWRELYETGRLAADRGQNMGQQIRDEHDAAAEAAARDDDGPEDGA